jgi:hypothetical protein
MRKLAPVILLIPILYVLSIAPAAWLISRGLVPESVGQIVYWPIEKAYHGSQEARKAIDLYVGPFRQ